MSTKFYIKDNNGNYASFDGNTRYTMLEGKALFDFLKSENGRHRTFFVDIDEDGNKTGIEADPKMMTICNEQHERDRYRMKLKNKLNITVIPSGTVISVPGEDKIELIEAIADSEADVEANAMRKFELETMRKALQKLNLDEYHLIYHLYLSDEPVTERQYAKSRGLHYMTVHNRKVAILKKLKKYF